MSDRFCVLDRIDDHASPLHRYSRLVLYVWHDSHDHQDRGTFNTHLLVDHKGLPDAFTSHVGPETASHLLCAYDLHLAPVLNDLYPHHAVSTNLDARPSRRRSHRLRRTSHALMKTRTHKEV